MMLVDSFKACTYSFLLANEKQANAYMKPVYQNYPSFYISCSNNGKETKSKQQKRGFGPKRGTKLEPVKNLEAETERIIGRLEKETPINKKLNSSSDDISQGKVDFVQVESWGSGEPDEIESLKLKSFSPSFSSEKGYMDLYESLTRRLQLLESQGEIKIARAKPLPPFEKWSFGPVRYLRYLKNQLTVHCSLEAAISRVVEIGGSSPDNSFLSLKIFGKDLGLSRSEMLQKDIDGIFEDPEVQKLIGSEKISVDTQSIAYAKYITQISTKSLDETDPEGARRKRLHLLAHVYSLHVSHLSSGMRIGAKAVSMLPVLRRILALSFYRDYPSNIKDPLKVFINSVNEAGGLLASDEDREEIMTELPKAFQKTSLLLSELAVEEKPVMIE